MIRKLFIPALAILIVTCCSQCKEAEKHQVTARHHDMTSVRAPAYPLVTIDPYTSVWSATDKLFDSPTHHWTGKVHPLIGAIRVDGEVYRFLGKEEMPLKAIVPMAANGGWEGSYTNKAPAKGWEQPDFNAKSWPTAKAAFGSPDMKGVQTVWNTKEIWVRREFTLPPVNKDADLFLIYSHDDDFELYLNGRQLVNTGNRAQSDVTLKLDHAMLNSYGRNVIAAHCTNRIGLAYVDFGIFSEGDRTESFTSTAVQDSVSLSATQTDYAFTCGNVGLNLKFTSPLLPNDLDLLSRPVSYIDYSVMSKDGKEHDVEIYFEITPQWAVDEVDQEVEIKEGKAGSVAYLKTGTTAQQILKKAGDNVRIDWGYAYLAADQKETAQLAIGEYSASKQKFKSEGSVTSDGSKGAIKMTDTMPVMAYVNKLGKVSGDAVSNYLMIGYDDVESVQYFGKNLKAWWTQNGTVNIDNALQKASSDHAKIIDQCIDFDNALWDETLKAGGKKYADLCVLAFRQSIAAHKLTKDSVGNILFLSKENFSNGSIGTVDITYPSAPLYLKYNPELLKGMMNPIFYYSESGKWNKPFAAHDVGTYPKANGQTYGEDMPVEECGNMLILAAAIAKTEGNANYASAHWDVLTTWANFLLKNGLDPKNQLCTDDFAGHLAHNANLSIKAIVGIAAYGMLADMLDKKDDAATYKKEAARMATAWEKMAKDGDHYRLTFDQPGTWSQKYNMVWDKLLGFNLFPKEIAQTEIKYYLAKQNSYGLPLDSRREYSKSDWIVWTATLADDDETFRKFIDPLYEYVVKTPDRVPMSDWYETKDAKQVGFQARSVVGGYFIKLLKK